MLNLKKNLRLVKEQKREPSPSLLVQIGLRIAHIIWVRVGFTQKLVSAPKVLNSRKDTRKDGVFFVECRRTYVLNNYKV